MNRTHFDVAPDPALDPQLGLLLAMLDDGTAEWREELGEVSQEAIVWQPHPHGHSIGGVVLHIIDVEIHWLHHVAAGQPRDPEELKTLLSEETDQYGGRWPAPPKKPLAWYFSKHDAVRRRTRDLVRQLTDPQRTTPRKGRTFTLRWMLHHVIAHEAYHGGQAVLLAVQHAAGT